MTNNLELVNAPIDSLVPNTWNTNHVTPENLEKIKESLTRFGMFRPIIIREVAGQKEIVGGYHRWTVAKDLGYTHVPVINLGAISENKAKEIGLVDNGRYGEDDILELSALLKDLGGAEAVAMYMPYSDSELDSIFTAESIVLDEIGDADEDMLDLEGMVGAGSKAPKTHQIMRFKIPIEDSDFVTRLIETTMRSQGFTEEDALSNAGNALIHLLKSFK